MTVRSVLTVAASGVAVAGVVLSMASLAAQAPAPPPAPTFTKNVAPILYKNCTSCHRAGEIAPMSLLTYEEVRPWAKSMRDKVTAGQMPPWHADSAFGHFKNDRH